MVQTRVISITYKSYNYSTFFQTGDKWRHLAGFNDLLKQEEADHGYQPGEAQPDRLLVLVMIVTMAMMLPTLRLAHLGEEGVRQQVEERVPGEGAHG